MGVQRLLEQTAQMGSPIICPVGSSCKFHVKMHSNSHETDNTGVEADKQMDMSFDMIVQATGEKTFSVKGENFVDHIASTRAEENVDLVNEVAKFNNCLKHMIDIVTEDGGKFSALMAEPTGSTISQDDQDCMEDAQEFSAYVTGAFEVLANPTEAAAVANEAPEHTSGPVTSELLEFADVQHQLDSKKTTHYRREVHDDGSVTVHRQYNIEYNQDSLPAPFLLQADDNSLASAGTGNTKVDSAGKVTSSEDAVTSTIGKDSPDGLTCVPDPSKGKTCETAEADAKGPPKEKVRMETKFDYIVTKVQEEELLQELETLDQFWQRQKAAGRVAVPLHKVTSTIQARKQVEPRKVDEGMPSFVEYLEAAPASEYEKSGTKTNLEKTMRSQQIRKRVVALIQDGAIHNQRAVQALMHVIGRVGMDDSTALTQLVQMASNENLDLAARQQALMALLQSKCYNHDHSIQQLSKLTQNPNSDVELMALHVKYGLIGHAEHCAHGAYGNADSYRMLLQEAHQRLSSALESGDEHASQAWLTAIANTNSQHADDTAAVAAVAHHKRLSPPLRMYAIQALGKLFTPEARKHLSTLAADSTNSFLQYHAEKALQGEHLMKGDKRLLTMAKSGMVDQLTQIGDTQMGVKREKVWPMPSSGDLRAEPKVGVEIYKDNDKPGKPFCLHGYAGVDGKAWTWTVSLIQAGGEKCSGHDFEKYISILNIKVWPGSSRGSVHPQVAQFSQASDEQGKCNMNVDAADLVATIAYDWTFFEYDKTFTVAGIPINGLVKLEGEIGLKVGWGNLGDPNVDG